MELRKLIKEMVDQELDEMARISTNIKIGDKAESAKKLYDGTWIGDMIKYVEEAGDVGISQPDLATKLGKGSQQSINPRVRDFLNSGVFTKGELSIPKKEKTKSDIPGRPAGKKLEVAKEVNSKLEADNDYKASEEEIAVLGPEYIEKLRLRVKGLLKRGRPLSPSKPPGELAAVKNAMASDEEIEDIEDEDDMQESLNEISHPENIEDFLDGMINMSIPEDSEEGEKISGVWEASEYADEDAYGESADEFKKAWDYIKSKNGITVKGNPDVKYTALKNGDIKYELTVSLNENNEIKSHPIKTFTELKSILEEALKHYLDETHEFTNADINDDGGDLLDWDGGGHNIGFTSIQEALDDFAEHLKQGGLLEINKPINESFTKMQKLAGIIK